MAGQLTLRIITPERIVFDEPVESVRLPALDGSLGVLPRHAPMVVALEMGLLRYRKGGAEETVFVGSGFAEVSDNVLRVVASVGELARDIDEERARAAEQRARERLSAKEAVDVTSSLDSLRAEAALRRAELRL
ncbi:MAG TPA: ATP synthase F1 subunit epsilon, partial [Planctomycetota bacterium]|nr:ATP synthase F1 subunit epsilon [Planctomycetota bacterium]